MRPDIAGDFETKFNTWEETISKYEKIIKDPLTDNVKIAALMTGCLEQLNVHLRLNAGAYETCFQVRDCVLNFVRTEGAGKRFTNDDPMDVSGLYGRRGYKGGKGKFSGKSKGKKGKGKFNFKGKEKGKNSFKGKGKGKY